FALSPFSGPLSEDSQRLLKSPRKPQRKVPKNPYKVVPDCHIKIMSKENKIDWSSQNMLSVGLNTCVYLWSACNSQVIKLCDLVNDQDTVTSVQWADKGELLAVGTNRGITQIWDVHTQKMTMELSGHTSRVGCLAWNGDLVCSGSRDRHIIQRDIRQPHLTEKKMSAHRQEVCNVAWSKHSSELVSTHGYSLNQVIIWKYPSLQPVTKLSGHQFRVLYLVCNVAWSKHSSELVSTHGYSLNQVIIWKYPSLQPVTKLSGHQFRVLYLAMSPDGESIVTGAGDETLRFWHVFSKSGQQRAARSKLNLFHSLR
ncbi:WD domain, G-beta repeat protein, partial [Necator americanus]